MHPHPACRPAPISRASQSRRSRVEPAHSHTDFSGGSACVDFVVPSTNRPLAGSGGSSAPLLACLLGACTAFAQPPPSSDPVTDDAPARARRTSPCRASTCAASATSTRPSSDFYKIPDLLKDTPQSITVVPPEIMREQAAFSLRDALRNVTGISLAAGEGGGAQGDNLTLRGFSGAQRHLPRRRARLRHVHARHVQPRVGRGAEGPVVRACSVAAPRAASSTR